MRRRVVVVLATAIVVGLGAAAALGNALSRSSRCAWHATLSGAPSASLLSILGVLRQGSAPHVVPRGPLSRGFPAALGIEIYSSYVRFARTFDGRSYYIVPVHFDGCVAGIGRRRDGIWLLTGHGGGGGDTANSIEAGRAAATAGPGIPGDRHSGTVSMVVPDGVAGATIRYPAGPANGFQPKIISPAVTINATARGNVLVFNVPRGSGGRQIFSPTSMTWRNATGAVVRRFYGRL